MKRLVVLLAVLSGLLLAAPVSVTPAAGAAMASSSAGDRWVVVTAPDQELRRGCRDYKFAYRVDVPGDEWMVELFFVGPRGANLGSETFESAAQRPAERRTWSLCRSYTRPGVHEIRVKVTSYDGREASERWMAPTRFRLHR